MVTQVLKSVPRT